MRDLRLPASPPPAFGLWRAITVAVQRASIWPGRCRACLLALLMLVGACTDSGFAEPDPVLVRGTVLDVLAPASTTQVRILIARTTQPGGDAIVLVSPTTSSRSLIRTVQRGVADGRLAPGQEVTFLVAGVELRSLPPQLGAIRWVR
jgi:hypothetical protein